MNVRVSTTFRFSIAASMCRFAPVCANPLKTSGEWTKEVCGYVLDFVRCDRRATPIVLSIAQFERHRALLPNAVDLIYEVADRLRTSHGAITSQRSFQSRDSIGDKFGAACRVSPKEAYCSAMQSQEWSHPVQSVVARITATNQQSASPRAHRNACQDPSGPWR